MRDETLVVLEEYNTVTEAEIAKSILGSAGIESTIRNEYMAANFPVVCESDYERAKQLLRHR